MIVKNNCFILYSSFVTLRLTRKVTDDSFELQAHSEGLKFPHGIVTECHGEIVYHELALRIDVFSFERFFVDHTGYPMFIRQIAAILLKDLKAEWRTREICISMFVFAILVIVVFNFAIGADPELIQQVAPGVLWVALLFATVLGLQRAAQVEYEEDCLSGILLAMAERSALFIAKTAGNMLYLLLITICTLPLFSIWFRIDLFAQIAPLSVVLLLGMLGFSAIGTLFSIITLNTRTREIMLPLLFLPVSVPLTIASVYATAKLIAGNGLSEITDYLTLMGVFDVVFVVVALLVFDAIVEE